MPPKKQEEESVAPVVVWTVLPVIWNSSEAVSALKKPVTSKKTVDRAKLIQLLREKGIDKYLSEGVLSRQGELLICQNMHTVAQQYLAQCRKPADPKKDQKKDTKKDSKKEEVVVEQAEKPLEFDFEKTVTEFLIYLEIPLDSQALQVAVNNGFKPEVIVWIEEQVKEGTQIPHYNLLDNQRTLEDFIKQMNSTLPQSSNSENKAAATDKKELFKKEIRKNIQRLRMLPNSSLQNTIIIEVPFQRDLQHPENDTQYFLTNLFKRLCELSMKKQQFDNWCKNIKVVPMVPTIKESVRREVVVEQKKEDKKGGKGAPAQPVTEIIQEVVEKKYESFPQNIKSDLVLYNRISGQRKEEKGKSKYYNILQSLILAISSATQSQPKTSYLQGLAQSVWSKQRNKPFSKITVNNLKDQLQEITSSEYSTQLTFPVKITAHPVTSEVTLASIVKQYPLQTALEHQYKLQQFTSLNKALGSRVFFSFDHRKYVQRLDAKELNARINQQLQFDPKIYHGQCVDDKYNLMILARVNPPGRVLYSNYIFDWKVRPNFHYWETLFQNKQQTSQYFDYGWRDAGNLKILSKKMMPTDNAIITESLFSCGDSQNILITLSKENVLYGLQKVRQSHLFWKQQNAMKTAVYTNFLGQKANKAELEVSFQRKAFTVLFTPYPIIYWHQNQLEVSRSFGANGQITKRMKDGSVQIMYPNGDISTLRFGKWTHFKNNSFSTDDGQGVLKIDSKIDIDKQIWVRQDSTVFVTYPNKDKSIIFKDGTHFKKIGTKKVEILNPEGIVIRINLAREKDFNVIGSGSAFAYLGFSSLLERSFDGAIYELHHPSFSWHSYTQGIDRAGTISYQKVFLLSYPDKSIIKLNDQGILTFMDKATNWSRQNLQQRWIQLFTAPEYHREGVYDVDLLEGQISTRDAESNHFRARVDGTGKTEIAVSFNIGGLKEEKNHFGQGMHVPDQNYFLPPPNNCITPRLFVIYPDGRGQEYLTDEQIDGLRSWHQIKETVNGRKITQFTRQAVSESQYFENTFSARIQLSAFSKPNGIQEAAIRPNNIRYKYCPLHFRSIEEIQWTRDFSKIKEVQESIRTNRDTLLKQVHSLRSRIKS